MTLKEFVPFSSLTTLKVGGAARYVVVCADLEEVKTALTYARERGLSWYVLGGGSNILASDEGYDGVLIQFQKPSEDSGISFEQFPDHALVIADAGVPWDTFVDACAKRELWGVENLAGIPGTVGAAPVQNIGAYGMEVADTLAWVEVLDAISLEVRRLETQECKFSYRDSIFKHNRSLIISRVAFFLVLNGVPSTSYKDIATRIEEGALVSTPQEIGTLIRSIRSQKFPDLSLCGTAGSFFKNPIVTHDTYSELRKSFPEIPSFESPQGVKLSLAWILDKALSLKGFTQGAVRLFERQPLVLVTEVGATAKDVNQLADTIAQKVFEATNISIEREVQLLNDEQK